MNMMMIEGRWGGVLTFALKAGDASSLQQTPSAAATACLCLMKRFTRYRVRH